MGNTCCNYAGGKDPHALEDNGKAVPIKMDPKISEEMMREIKKHEKKIVKIQSCWRGSNTRKKLKLDDHIN